MNPLRHSVISGFVGVAVLAGAVLSMPALAAEAASQNDAVVPLSASQSTLLRNVSTQHATSAMRAAEPMAEDVPATRSQIELLDRGHVDAARGYASN